VEDHREDTRELKQDRSTSPWDEGAFVSPEELEDLLSALDTQDGHFLESDENLPSNDEGDFLSPEDLGDSSTQDPGIELPPPQAQQGKRAGTGRPVSEIDDPALLSRIASELRSIKSELSHLKTSYDDALNQTAVSGQSQNPALIAVQTPEEQQQILQMPEALYQEMKKLLSYLDRLLESLPEEKIDQFARSEYFDLYRKVFEYFDLV